MQNFIKTNSESIAIQLKKLGFTELPKQGTFFVFLNNGTANFSEEDKKKVIYTNKLCI